MKQTRKTLLIELYGYLSVVVLILVLFETNIILSGSLLGNGSLIYMQFVMQLSTLIVIPFALYMFKIKSIAQSVSNHHSSKGLLLWGSVRTALLCIPAIINILLYYLYGEEVGFFYLSLILLISIPFIYPSKSRCGNLPENRETTNEENKTNP